MYQIWWNPIYVPSHEQVREHVQYHEMVESTILSMSRSGKHVSYCTVYDGIGIP